MKRQNKIKTIIQLSAIVMLLCSMMLSACTAAQKQKIPVATYMGGNDTIKEVCREMEDAGASNVDVFQEWVVDFAASAGSNAKLEDAWSNPEKMRADTGKCMDGWEQNHDYSDSNCRMTAFLLLDGLLHAETMESSYNGSYLMFDTEAIDNVDRYEIIKENRDMFTTLYGEKSLTDENHPETTFSDNWQHYGFQIDSDRISLLSIAIYDPDSDVVFVGHTGILIKYSDYYLFVEKIAFEQPYQATKVHNMDELLHILSLRPEYFGEEGEIGPFVYCNGEYIGTLKKNI
ncbi:MAG: DUF4300 family protein [Roseburia sp.]|uniref:DUF4300 family protein n=1 Tax=Roseburia sp. 831b TaxID=1261635 RepID=UPI001FA83DA5|nr:DUF4300 family protein [Roseburia sp. 831b]MCI5919789.1 DUF4300 family protein [Roseburia sp.]MDY5884521.1 DUF4300 family protein [Roseburia sp.]WVK74605.1 DUF4300 family protein [Roseburia sp. 831b]